MRDELDTLLDEAIKSYSAVEPSPDLAGRILRQSQRETPSPRRGWKLALAFGLPLTAAVALATVLLGQWALPKPPLAIASAPATPSAAAPAISQRPKEASAALREPVRTHARKVHAARSWARPLPPPYSKEELALLNFVQQHPKEAAEIAEAQKQDSGPLRSEPIAISQLEIKPLTIAPLN